MTAPAHAFLGALEYLWAALAPALTYVFLANVAPLVNLVSSVVRPALAQFVHSFVMLTLQVALVVGVVLQTRVWARADAARRKQPPVADWVLVPVFGTLGAFAWATLAPHAWAAVYFVMGL